MDRRMISTSMTGTLWIFGAAALGLLVTACNPSPHINVDAPGGSAGAGGSSTTSTTGGGGSGGATTTTSTSGGSGGMGPCTSNAGCSYPNNLCDVASGECVECLVTEDCDAKPGTVCSNASCICPNPSDFFCAEDGYGAARCVSLETTGTDCGDCGHHCFGACSAGQCVDAWEPTATVGAPSPRAYHVAVWTGSKMIVWGGDSGGGPLGDGALYDPATRLWTPMSNANAPSPRSSATAVWTGAEMIVWGGRGAGNAELDDGRKYDPTTDTWTNVETGGPAGRHQHTAIWTTGAMPDRMIVWGGYDGANEINTGAYYTGSEWLGGNLDGVLSQRRLHTAVWDDVAKRMIVFGGLGFDPVMQVTTSLGSLGVYGPLPGTEGWLEINPSGPAIPQPRYEHTAVWAGTHMIVWGGYNSSIGVLNDGARFDFLGSSEWSPMDGVAPPARRRHTAVYFKNLNKMVVWGGLGGNGAPLNDGGLFNVTAGAWSATGVPTGPLPTADHTAVVAGSRMIIWGGITTGGGTTKEGAVLDMTKVP